MKKPIQPGSLCFLRGTVCHDGAVVTAVRFAGMTQFAFKITEDYALPNGSPEPAWFVEPSLLAEDGRMAERVPSRLLFPLDNPGDDEIDSISFRKNIHETSHS